VIHACAKAGNADRAEHWLSQMTTLGVKPNIVSYNAVLNACAKNGDIARAESWLAKAIDAGVMPDVISYNTLITAFCKEDKVDLAHALLKGMDGKGITPTTVSYIAVMQAYSRLGKPQEVEGILSEMRRRRLPLTGKCLVALLLAYRHSSQSPVESADVVTAFTSWFQRGAPVDGWTIQALCRTIGRSNAERLCSDLGIKMVELENEKAIKEKEKESQKGGNYSSGNRARNHGDECTRRAGRV